MGYVLKYHNKTELDQPSYTVLGKSLAGEIIFTCMKVRVEVQPVQDGVQRGTLSS